MQKYLLLIFFILGLLLRVIVSFYNYSGDVPTHMLWGKIGADYGLKGIYEINFMHLYGYTSPNYPPLMLYFFTSLYLLKKSIFEIAWFLNLHIPFFPSNLIYLLRDFDYYPYLLKLPAILSDLGIAYVAYLFFKKILKKKKSHWPQIAVLAVLFNPAYIYNSAYWGQVDSIPLFFLLLSFYILLYSKQYIHSGIIFTLGLLTKQTVFIFIPLYLLLLFRFSDIKKFLATILTSIVLIWIIFFPILNNGNIILYPFLTYWNKILTVSGLSFTSNHAFNFWYLITGSRVVLASSKFLFNISYEMLGYIITLFLFASISIKLFKSKLETQNIFYAGFLLGLTSYIFLTKMHERHLILVLPFLLLVFYKNSLLFCSFVFISLFNFLNMYHNWWSPQVALLKSFLSSNLTIVTLIILLLLDFGFLLMNYLRSHTLLFKR